jgi:hypothetical protein
MDLIIYHGKCPDGWAAAYIASKRYPEARLMPREHGMKPPYDDVEGQDVLVLDFSWPTREINDELAATARSFRILDHHKTAQVVLEGAPYAVFDMKRSGAGLAWDYLFGENSPEACYDQGTNFEPRPWYVNYVEDRDLWNWALPGSKEICAYLGTLELNKEDWDKLDATSLGVAAGLGAGAYAHIQHYVREAVKQAQVGILQGWETAVLNVPYLNCSEVGNKLAAMYEVSLTWFERGDGITQFSLRSIGDIDVSVIAKVFGGGGHKNASGFQMGLHESRGFIDAVLGRGSSQRSPGGCA